MVWSRDRLAHLTRLRLPMRLRCDACCRQLDKHTMFLAKEEELTAGERYIGAAKVFRFYFRCRCRSGLIVFRTDPDNNDYTVEEGATREFD